jgi:hypothetical protein
MIDQQFQFGIGHRAQAIEHSQGAQLLMLALLGAALAHNLCCLLFNL